MMRRIAFTVFCCASALYADDANPQFALPPNLQSLTIPINVSVTNASSSDAASVTKQDSIQNADVSSSSESASVSQVKDITFSQKVSESGAAVAALLAAQLHEESSSFRGFISSCFANKFKLALGSAALLYCYVFYRLKKMEWSLLRDHCWSLWKNQLSLQELYMINNHDLIKDLLVAIQGRYTNVHNLDDFNTPLTFFVRDIDDEGRMLTSYEKTVRWLERLRLRRLFSINTTLIEQAAPRRERLNYLKGRVWSWISENKVNYHTA